MLYVENPASGDGVNRLYIRSQLQDMLEHGHLRIIKTTGNDDLETVRDAIRAQQWDAILIGGGDGTINMVGEAAGDLDVPMGIIPAGSANGLAACLGIRNVDEAISAISKGHITTIDVLKVDGGLCVHMADFGFNAGVVKRFAQGGERGMMAYFKSSLNEFLEMRPYRFLLDIDGQTEEFEAKMLVIANGDRYGTGAVINPGGSLQDGKFEVIALNPEGLDEMVSVSIALFRETLAAVPSVKIWQAGRAVIQNVDGAPFQVDGEVKGEPEKTEVVCRSAALKFFTCR